MGKYSISGYVVDKVFGQAELAIVFLFEKTHIDGQMVKLEEGGVRNGSEHELAEDNTINGFKAVDDRRLRQ